LIKNRPMFCPHYKTVSYARGRRRPRQSGREISS
jgi:hypothetical protein